ncbi:hypothetical protein [Hymenobacter sp. B81]|uniref:hypothetical protein n=1 Tax=Hymenobacter sp. B81 TaxID=3344878 RepID=UPI0037DC9B89
MARDTALLTARNKKLRADYNRLVAEESVVKYKGERVLIKLTYAQVLKMLSVTYHISPRTIEGVLAATAPKMAVINAKTAVQTAQEIAAV